jgi:hypothetical protein
MEAPMIKKQKLLRTITIVAAGLVACLSGQAVQASTVQVGLCKTGLVNFTTIQAAVNAVPAGSVIEVCPGTYPEQVTITKKLTLEGIASGSLDAPTIVPPSPAGLAQNGTDINGNAVYPQILVTGTGAALVTITHLTVNGTGNNVSGCGSLLEGIYYKDSSGSITDNVVQNQFPTDFTDYGGCGNGLAVNVESDGNVGAATVTISSNFVSSYDKNGITASGNSSVGPAVTIEGNYVVGLGSTAMNWISNAPAAENGIQVGFGATGKVTLNTTIDDVWGPDPTNSTPVLNAATGILVFASTGITVSDNQVGSTQYGIAIVSGTGYGFGLADGAAVTANRISGTQVFDGIDLCSNSNTVESNIIYGSTESGIHADGSSEGGGADACSGSSGTPGSTGNSNTIENNTINGACAGVLNGGTSNTITPNTVLNVTNTSLVGDACPAVMTGGGTVAKPAASSNKQHRVGRPSPYIPAKR